MSNESFQNLREALNTCQRELTNLRRERESRISETQRRAREQLSRADASQQRRADSQLLLRTLAVAAMPRDLQEIHPDTGAIELEETSQNAGRIGKRKSRKRKSRKRKSRKRKSRKRKSRK